MATGTIMWEDAWDIIREEALIPLQEKLESDHRTHPLFSSEKLLKIYSLSYQVCTQKSPHNWSDNLYQNIISDLSVYLRNKVLVLEQLQGVNLLKEFIKCNENNILLSKWYVRFFSYLDRYHVVYHQLPTVTKACERCFDNTLLVAVKERVATEIAKFMALELIASVSDEVLEERGQMIATVSQIYVDRELGVIDAVSLIVQPIRTLYAQKVQSWLAQEGMNTADYMQSAGVALAEATRRFNAYFDSSRENIAATLVQVVDAQLLIGARELVLKDLKRDFSTFPDMTSTTRTENSCTLLIQSLVDLRVKYEQMAALPCGDNNTLHARAVQLAFGDLVRYAESTCRLADMLATDCDRLLKPQVAATGANSISQVSDIELEDYLERAVQLFSYFTDQDIFAEIYRNLLARRLLNQRSASDDMERLMVSKLKSKCGAQFTAKMEGMLNDLAIGSEHAASFKQFCDEHHKLSSKIEFCVQVLTLGFWPQNRTLNTVKLPSRMQRCVQVFREYYAAKTSGRRLQWTYSLGQCSVRGTFDYHKVYELQVTTLQAIVMLAFNQDATCPGGIIGAPISFVTLQDALGLPDDILKRVLHSLSCGKYKILKRVACGATADTNGDRSALDQAAAKEKAAKIALTDVFAFNEQFTHTVRKFRIPMSLLEEGAPSHNSQRVEEDRCLAIEAAIVRVMKARGTLTHQQLVAEVLSAIAVFRPDPKVIKQRIESLIDREYMQRDADTPNSYKYLA